MITDERIAKSEILRTTVGSQVHGINIEGQDDQDLMGIFIEPASMVIGLDSAVPTYTWRTQPEGARSGPGDTDLVIYSLRHFLQLAIKGNPTVLLPLYAPQDFIVKMTEDGRRLRCIRDKFLSQEAAHRFLHYCEQQRERMMGEGRQSKVPNRPEIIEKYGYDTKYASHAVRLIFQAREIIDHGRLTLPMPSLARKVVLGVKQGEMSREDVNVWISERLKLLWDKLDKGNTVLPVHPDRKFISNFSEQTHFHHWRLTFQVS